MNHKFTSCASIALAGLLAVCGMWAMGCDKSEEPASPIGTVPAVVAAVTYANATCPIMGSKIDPANVTDSLVRDFKGRKVAFCCGSCPGQWDKLSDEDKVAKLAAAK